MLDTKSVSIKTNKGEIQLLNMMLLLIPVVGTLWFLNLISLIKRIKDDGFINNLLFLGAFLSFIFIFLCMYTVIGLH
jgi:hypothetical protein